MKRSEIKDLLLSQPVTLNPFELFGEWMRLMRTPYDPRKTQRFFSWLSHPTQPLPTITELPDLALEYLSAEISMGFPRRSRDILAAFTEAMGDDEREKPV